MNDIKTNLLPYPDFCRIRYFRTGLKSKSDIFQKKYNAMQYFRIGIRYLCAKKMYK